MRKSRVVAERVVDETGRSCAVEVLRRTYQREKLWISDCEWQFPPCDLERPEISRFLVSVRGMGYRFDG